MKKVIEKLKKELRFHNKMKELERYRKKRIFAGYKVEEPYHYEQDYIEQLEKAIAILEETKIQQQNV